ncbi:MAG TPA: P-loop NTPase, partial [Clostridia bacterium]|nr:P-loop NTPase [Clostridia bacterium]
MSECDGNCSGCSQKGGCDSVLKKLEQNKNSNIKKVIGVVSGKGGVGKSLTTASLATVFRAKGYNTAIIDGDITGASIPNIFGLKSGIESDGESMIPAVTKTGIKAISINLLLETPDSPVVWRGSMLSNVL